MRLLTVAEVADLRETSSAAVRELIARGRLPAKKYGTQWLVKESDALKITKQKTGPKGPRKPK